MMKKVFMPFWSYDVEKTEKWLSFMASQGDHLVKINMLTRQFYFEEGTPQEITYTIGFDKANYTLPTALVNDGWQEVFKHGYWYVIANESAPKEIKFTPVREGIVSHNRKIMYLFGGILLYMLISASIPIFLTIVFLFFIPDATVTVVGSPMWILPIAVGTPVWLLTVYSTVKLYKTNRRLDFDISKETGNKSRNHKEEKILKRSGKRIVKRRVGWMYSPDKLEKWLEEMEEKGYNLHRIGKFGITFFFVKDAPRKVSYYADYQNNTNQSYFDMHQEAGWRLMYTSKALLSKWSIWSRVYESGEERPQLYSDNVHMLKHARRVAITYLAIYVPLMIMYIGIIALNINSAITNRIGGMEWFIIILSGLVTIEFGVFSLKSWLYYRRTKIICSITSG